MFQQNELIYIDFSKAGLTAEQKAYFLQHLIIHQQQLQAFCKKLRLDCIELEIEITFDMFWEKYGYKVDRKRAEANLEQIAQSQASSCLLRHRPLRSLPAPHRMAQ